MKVNKTSVLLVLIASLFMAVSVSAEPKDAANSKQAREIFNRTYQMVFGPQGSMLHYDVNIIGLYKTSGDICYKGKKMRYSELRYASWNDGVTAYMVDRKKKKVDIYKANSDKKDKYLNKFKFNIADFEYSWSNAKEGYLLSIKVKHAGLT